MSKFCWLTVNFSTLVCIKEALVCMRQDKKYLYAHQSQNLFLYLPWIFPNNRDNLRMLANQTVEEINARRLSIFKDKCPQHLKSHGKDFDLAPYQSLFQIVYVPQYNFSYCMPGKTGSTTLVEQLLQILPVKPAIKNHVNPHIRLMCKTHYCYYYYLLILVWREPGVSLWAILPVSLSNHIGSKTRLLHHSPPHSPEGFIELNTGCTQENA